MLLGGASRILHPSPFLAILPKVSGCVRGMAVDAKRREGVPQPRPPSQIPGPKRWPLLGSALALWSREDWRAGNQHLVWESLAREYGPIFRLDVPGYGRTVFVSDPKDIETLMKATFHMTSKPMFGIISAVRNKSPNVVKGQTGIMSEQGEEWWRVRRLTQAPAVKTVTHYLPQMDIVARQFVNRMSQIRDRDNELPDDFFEELSTWALESLGLLVFNRRMGCVEGSPEGRRLIATVHGFHHGLQEGVAEPLALWRWVETPGFKKFKHANGQLEVYVLDAIKAAMKTLESGDKEDLNLLEKLLLTPGLSKEDVLVFMVDFLFAGIQNTATTVAFTMLNLARNPDKQARLQEELDRVLGDGKQPLTAAQLGKLSYTKACVKENLRLCPSSNFVPRLLDKDLVLGGYLVPKGFQVLVPLTVTRWNEDAFPKASEFLPERFLRGEGKRTTSFASLPFGFGTRMCIGKRIAEQMIHTLLARIFHKYRISWTHGAVDTKMQLVLSPVQPLKFTIEERN